MRTTLLPADDEGRWLNAAVRTIQDGRLVAVATETVYGLAGDATSAEAIAAIYAAKGRPSTNPLIVHVASLEQARTLGVFSAAADRLAQAHWPGPLTLVLPLRAGAGLAPAVTAGGASIALRCPDGPLRALARASDRPLAAPSANLSGTVSPTTAAHVRDDLDGRIAMIVDSGPTAFGLESTIVDARSDDLRILRPGALTAEALAIASVDDAAEDTAPVAPGLMSSHYAPKAPVRLDVLPGDVRPGEAYLGFGKHALAGSLNLSAAGDAAEAARGLYAALRASDSEDVAGIAVAPIPLEGMGIAIRNRLARAAHGRGWI